MDICNFLIKAQLLSPLVAHEGDWPTDPRQRCTSLTRGATFAHYTIMRGRYAANIYTYYD